MTKLMQHEIADYFGISRMTVTKALQSDNLRCEVFRNQKVIDICDEHNVPRILKWCAVTGKNIYASLPENSKEINEENVLLSQEHIELDLELKRMKVEQMRIEVKKLREKSIPKSVVIFTLEILSENMRKYYQLGGSEFRNELFKDIDADEEYIKAFNAKWIKETDNLVDRLTEQALKRIKALEETD